MSAFGSVMTYRIVIMIHFQILIPKPFPIKLFLTELFFNMIFKNLPLLLFQLSQISRIVAFDLSLYRIHLVLKLKFLPRLELSLLLIIN